MSGDAAERTRPSVQEALAALEGPSLSADPTQLEPGDAVLRHYFEDIADAHFVIRRVFRIVDEQSRAAGLDPLEHKLLIQVFGAKTPLRISEAAFRLDIPAALASRLVSSLERTGLVERAPAPKDRRIAHLVATEAGAARLARIHRSVHMEIGRFREGLVGEDRLAALRVFAFYLGLDQPGN